MTAGGILTQTTRATTHCKEVVMAEAPPSEHIFTPTDKDPATWLRYSPLIGFSNRRWYVLHRKEGMLMGYVKAFIPPAKVRYLYFLPHLEKQKQILCLQQLPCFHRTKEGKASLLFSFERLACTFAPHFCRAT